MSKALEKFQKFGGAMFTPVLLLAPAGMIIGITVLFLSPEIMGDWVADEDGLWYQIWSILSNGAWALFKQMPLIFAFALPIGLAKKQNARCCFESLVLFLVFHYFVSTILYFWGDYLNVEYSDMPTDGSKMTLIANIPTLNMGIFGSLVISGIVVWLHNRLFDVELPTIISVFNGSVAVFVVGFFVMIPVAVFFSIVWPIVQDGIVNVSYWLTQSGDIGVFFFGFFEKALLPFGLHHMVYFPIQYDSIVVEGGTYAQWLEDLPDIAASTDSLRSLAPYGGFMLTALSSIFGQIGIAAAFYATAKPEKRKKLVALLVPLVLTAAVCAITEPIEYTFLFVAPVLFYVHAFLAACLQTVVYALGITGSMAGNLFEQLAINYIPLWSNHWVQYLILLAIGIAFTFIYFFVFRFLILKFNFKTPGREDEKAVEFISKKQYQDRRASKDSHKGDKKGKDGNSGGTDEEGSDSDNADANELSFEEKILEGLGGKDNIVDVTNCATRLRVNVKDGDKVQDDVYFKSIGAFGATVMGTSVQVIIGLKVASVRDDFERLLD